MVCENLEQVRENIDIIDKKIVQLIAERSYYVQQAANFKKNTDEVKAPQRVEKVISKVRALAREYEVNPDIVESIYREMINSFINYELAQHKALDPKEVI